MKPRMLHCTLITIKQSCTKLNHKPSSKAISKSYPNMIIDAYKPGTDLTASSVQLQGIQTNMNSVFFFFWLSPATKQIQLKILYYST
jgi:hypothetical protein